MRSNIHRKGRLALLAATGLLLTSVQFLGCGFAGLPTVNEDYLIGQKLKEVSSLTAEDGGELNHIAIFDKTVKRIHQFDLRKNIFERTLEPEKPDGEHAVLFHQGGNYVIDMVDNYIGIYNRRGKLNSQPLQFGGKPVSAAFQPKLGIVVIYDDRQNIGVLKMNDRGDVASKWLGGPLLDASTPNPPSVKAGDVDSTGRLIVGMSDGSIAVVDLDQSMQTQAWVIPNTFTTTLKDIRWIAPVRGEPDQILVRSYGQISLVQLSTQSILDKQEFDEYGVRLKTSKVFDPHIIIRKGRTATMYYANGSLLNSRPLHDSFVHLLSSRLNLTTNRWTLLESTKQDYQWKWTGGKNGLVGVLWEADLPNIEKSDRRVHRYMPSTLGSMPSVKVRDEAEIEFTDRHLFQLFPSKFGYAEYTSMETGKTTVIKMFNKDYIGK